MFKSGIIRQLLFTIQDPDNPPGGKKLPPCPPYGEMSIPLPTTRSSSDKLCQCTVCEIARASGVKVHKMRKKALGDNDEIETPKAILKQCQKCYSYIGKGWEHKCDKNTKRANLEKLVKSSSKKSKTRMVTSGLKQVFHQAGVSTRGGTLGLSTRGKPLTVNLGTKATIKSPKWDLESLIKLQTKANLSDRTLM